MRLRKLWIHAAGLLASGVLSVVSAQQIRPPCLDCVMPFELVSGFEVVGLGRIGNLEGLRFIVDTGSSYSVIDRKVADRLGLRRRTGSVLNFDRSLAVEWADVSEVRFGPIRARGIGVMVAKLADISEYAAKADAIIGMDVLSRARRLSIDYERRRISFELDEARTDVASVAKAFVVSVPLQGLSLHMVVDTGLRYVLIYKDRLRGALPRMQMEGGTRKASLGRLQVTAVNLPGIRIFPSSDAVLVLLIDRPSAGINDVDGYLGAAALHARILELDFAARTVRWR